MTDQLLLWKTHTPELLKQICAELKALRIPLMIFQRTLAEVAERAIALNDPQLNMLMVRLTLYEESDPNSPQYNAKLCLASQEAPAK